jgi:hypothetical protein
MKTLHTLLISCALLSLLANTHGAQAQPYAVGAIVTNDLAMQNRFLWTNANGTVFSPSNSQIRLSDFDGMIVYYCFFDVW